VLATNTSTYTIVTNDLVAGTIYTVPNQRASVIFSCYTNATLTVPGTLRTMYSNAVDGRIYTNVFSIPLGVLANLPQTNTFTLSDMNPNSKFWFTGGTTVPNSTVVSYK
jgi:hypothetical protein